MIGLNQLSLNLNGKLHDFATPIVMSIVNITPDSFYKHSRLTSDKQILETVEKSLCDGATILDIGAYSTRPMANDITSDEETKRLAGAIELILKFAPDVVLSVDTFRADVARYVVANYNVAMINDIGGGTLDDSMFATIAELKVAYVLMHTRGNPQTMQALTNYDNPLAEVMFFLQTQLNKLRQLGVIDVVVDPGFGFAKTLEQNYLLLNQLSLLKELQAPILAGLSRKSMVSKLLETNADGALNGTTAVNMLALMGGANILRVHDVSEAIETIRIFNAYYSVN